MTKKLSSPDPQCEACGERPEVYGSSWCATCDYMLADSAKRRIIRLRNALIEIRTRRGLNVTALREIATQGLTHD